MSPLLVTSIRFFLTFPTVYLVVEDHRLLAGLCILLAAVSDWYDGEKARKTGQNTPLGSLMDPFVDKVFVLMVLSAFLYMGEVSLWAYLLLLLRELSMSFLRGIASQYGVSMTPSYLGKTKTLFEFLTLLSLVLYPSVSDLLLWIAIFFAYASAVEYLRRFVK
ncbi:CDP-alcohol phosphatidyltransferase [Thermocrinis albus DSM 14484]|uniref:CDP-diacylglycerol--glycerol-3-phosphate 3-phosphatidyltransferase n=1 Tax=Thermocrinis albus (strain DSM 14484 / JCM 11386 / HI 11/12) TaxID=638303 RepID=D3SP28_THEAH|nr:CDP-alcohol phosphatidyltransferase family protein [Thermocrinis albus]ADC88915.1 CDP-alcohol phosphatidyltransferase [Thermocrinis albus DSM 14484]